MSTQQAATANDGAEGWAVNEVRIIGRASGEPERRTLPSGDELVLLRVVVPRPGGGADTVPVSVGPAPARGRPGPGQVGRRLLADAQRLPAGERVEVTGALRRRWWRTPGGGPASRMEVQAASVARAAGTSVDETSVNG
ncbi:single-stranded DNA-binding protein [Egicoccus sp. AB-alg2]|uniref:single-stranded DNA-binding protein n=1 Tax=Egicoccus sp. AB-alg2 TaxID=3242693 RepID=UPI00359E0E08